MSNALGMALGGIVLLVSVGVSGGAFAAEIKSEGQVYSGTQCQYFSTNLGVLRFSYADGNLPWGTRLRVRYGFEDAFAGMPAQATWNAIGEIEMQAVAPYTWSATTDAIEVASRGTFSFSKVEFVFEVIAPDGAARFDNGGSPTGYYVSPLPTMVCSRTDQLSTLAISVVRQ